MPSCVPAGRRRPWSCASPIAPARIVTARLYPDAARPGSLFDGHGVSPGANVHPLARLEANVIVDPGAVIGPRAEIGAGAVIGPNAVIGPDVRIGRDCAMGAGATVLQRPDRRPGHHSSRRRASARTVLASPWARAAI